jgi:hypothetical protein
MSRHKHCVRDEKSLDPDVASLLRMTKEDETRLKAEGIERLRRGKKKTKIQLNKGKINGQRNRRSDFRTK